MIDRPGTYRIVNRLSKRGIRIDIAIRASVTFRTKASLQSPVSASPNIASSSSESYNWANLVAVKIVPIEAVDFLR